MIYVIFTTEGTSLPIAYKLVKEGNKVHVGQVVNREELQNDEGKEDKETKRRRLSLYKGIIKKESAKSLVEKLLRVRNKDNYAIFFDFNNMWAYSEKLLEAGFTKGLFPTKEDYLFEKDRQKAKEFVKNFYSDVKVAEEHEFKTTQEGIAFLQESENIFVLKSLGDLGRTVVPTNPDPELANNQLIDVLSGEEAKEYNKGGFILEQKIMNPIELTPQKVYLDGEPIFTDLDIENKYLGAGNYSVQTGCAQNLIVATELEDTINQIAFPGVVDDMAKKHKGIFIWDASLLVDSSTGEIYFGEFCPNRWGYDAVITEMAMSGDESGDKIVTSYFEFLLSGKNPLQYKFGTSVRIFNLHKGKDRRVMEDSLIEVDKFSEPDIWVYEMRKEGKELRNTGSAWDLAAATGFGNTIEESVDKNYDYVHGLSFEGKYFRPKADFLEDKYEESALQASIMERYKYYEDNY